MAARVADARPSAWRRGIAAVAAAAIALGGMACGGDDEGDEPTRPAPESGIGTQPEEDSGQGQGRNQGLQEQKPESGTELEEEAGGE